jgi:hypothetical protein
MELPLRLRRVREEVRDLIKVISMMKRKPGITPEDEGAS